MSISEVNPIIRRRLLYFTCGAQRVLSLVSAVIWLAVSLSLSFSHSDKAERFCCSRMFSCPQKFHEKIKHTAEIAIDYRGNFSAPTKLGGHVFYFGPPQVVSCIEHSPCEQVILSKFKRHSAHMTFFPEHWLYRYSSCTKIKSCERRIKVRRRSVCCVNSP
jgi:hypothetical protein